MESKNERIKRLFPKIIGMADELYPVYMPTDDYGYSNLENTTLFGHGMECFSFSTERLCYIAALRKLFLAVLLIFVRDGLIDIDLADIRDMEVDTYGNMVCFDRIEDESALMDILVRKMFDAYGYHYEITSYNMDDLADGIYDAASYHEACKKMESNCKRAMLENDYMHIDIYNLFSQVSDTEWYSQDDIRIWRFSNRWLCDILGRNHDMAAGSEKIILENISRLNYLLFPDEVSCGLYEYSRKSGGYEFAAIETAYISNDWHGYSEYWCRLDTAFLNFGALLTIPYIDALMDDVDLCRQP